MPAPETRPGGPKLFIAVAAFLLLAAILWTQWDHIAQPAIVDRFVDSKPVYPAEWLRLPTEDDVARLYPAKARREKLAVDVMVNMACAIREDGGLTDCVINEESLTGYGFGDAALKLSAKFKARTKAADGSSLTGLPVGIPLSFDPICAPDAEPKC